MDNQKFRYDLFFDENVKAYFNLWAISCYASTLDYNEIAYTSFSTAYDDFSKEEEWFERVCSLTRRDSKRVKILYRALRRHERKTGRKVDIMTHYKSVDNYLSER